MFLFPQDGDVGFTPWAHEAGRFDHLLEARETAANCCSEGFYVVTVSN